jgi:lysophospholipase L1-like esterase
MRTGDVKPRRDGCVLRACSATIALCLSYASMASVPLPFERNLADRPAFAPDQGFGFETSADERFSLRVPEGNYRVTVKITGTRPGVAAIWAEQRRLMSDEIRIRRNVTIERSFIVNVRTPVLGELPENAPGGAAVRLNPRESGSATWDDRLTVAMTSDFGARFTSIRVETTDVPTLYLAGDSTVADQGLASDGSWGQFLPRYFGPGIAVANHAESGESLKSFVTGHRLDKLLSGLRAGDWVMLQFGHNDQKTQWRQTFADSTTTYRHWLRTYIAEVRLRNATPVVVTPPERRNFDTQGRIRPTLAEYAQAIRVVAREEKVALIDLYASSVRFYEALGPALAPRAFALEGDDQTHHNEYGARQLARAVIEGLREANTALTAGLEKHIATDAGTFDASDPPLPDRKRRKK